MVRKRKHTGTIIISTFPDENSITKLSESLINKKKLCACISFTKTRSIYMWKNKLEDQEEYIALFKTTKLNSSKLKSEIKKMHPYDVPEIIELRVGDISKPYLSWMVSVTAIK